MEFVFSVVNDTTESAGLRLGFALTRTVFGRVWLTELPDGTAVRDLCLVERSVVGQWWPPIPPGAEVRVHLEADGEALLPLFALLSTRDGQWRTGRVLGYATGSQTWHADVVNEEAAIAMSGAEQLIKARHDAIIATKDDPRIENFKLFFWEYDAQTNWWLVDGWPGLSDDDVRRRHAIAYRMFVTLRLRLILRMEAARDGTPVPALERYDGAETAYISGVQLAIYRKYFHGLAAPADLAAAGEAFLRFASGLLRVGDANAKLNSEPDGAAEFLFAEFAVMAMETAEASADHAAWAALLPALVATQRPFADIYEPEPACARHHWLDYSASAFRPDRRDRWTMDRLKGELDDCAALQMPDLVRRHGENCARAFPLGFADGTPRP